MLVTRPWTAHRDPLWPPSTPKYPISRQYNVFRPPHSFRRSFRFPSRPVVARRAIISRGSSQRHRSTIPHCAAVRFKIKKTLPPLFGGRVDYEINHLSRRGGRGRRGRETRQFVSALRYDRNWTRIERILNEAAIRMLKRRPVTELIDHDESESEIRWFKVLYQIGRDSCRHRLHRLITQPVIRV